AAVAALAAQGFTVTGALPLLAIAGAEALRAWRADRRAPRLGAAVRESEEGLRIAGAVRHINAVAAVGFGLAIAALGVLRPGAAALALAAASLAWLPRLWVWLVAIAPLVYGLATHADPQRLFSL